MATQVITRPAGIAVGAQPEAASGLGELLARLNRWREERRNYRITAAKLDALSDHILVDIGVLRAEIDSIARRHAHQARAAR